MQRSCLFAVAAWLVLATSGVAQHGGHGARTSPEEASAIAEYWINSYFRRAADPREVQHWASEIVKSRSAADALAGFLSSREYLQVAGGSRAGLVHQLIKDVGHHEPSPHEVEDVMRSMGRMDPPQIAYEFLRQYPKNWWPGPAATPPRALRHLYERYGAPPRW
jgi:hypothetical protein